jgi:hypothetical protein
MVVKLKGWNLMGGERRGVSPPVCGPHRRAYAAPLALQYTVDGAGRSPLVHYPNDEAAIVSAEAEAIG